MVISKRKFLKELKFSNEIQLDGYFVDSVRTPQAHKVGSVQKHAQAIIIVVFVSLHRCAKEIYRGT